MTRASRNRPVLGMLAAAILAGSTSAFAADVSFRDAFNAALGQDVMAITVPDGDVLVFDGGPYYTQGRRMVVNATRGRIQGDVVIGFFAPDSRPPARSGVANTGKAGDAGPGRNCARSGCPGKQGKIGDTGASGENGQPATSIFVAMKELSGEGTLTFVTAGQAGGKGQKGGKGGTGGRGGDGAERSCGGAFGLDTRAGPGDGGAGGPGGPGGTGGPGGKGGAGGAVTLGAELAPLVRSGKIVVDTKPAEGGPGGDGGDKGDGGGGGGMGGGNSCGGGGTGGPGGGPGTPGKAGEPGPQGSPGRSRIEGTK